MSRRIGPEAKVLALFATLSDASKVIVFDVIKSQQPKKSYAQSAPRQSSRKGVRAASIANTKISGADAGAANGGDEANEPS